MTSKASYFESLVSNSGCSCVRAMNFFCFLSFLGKKSHSNYCQLRDHHAWSWNRVYVTFIISACICLTAMIFMLFRNVFRSRKSFQLSPFAWLSCVTLKLKVTSWSTWFLLFLLVFVLPRWIFVWFIRFSDQWIHSDYCQLRDLHVWPQKLKVASWSTWLFVLLCC